MEYFEFTKTKVESRKVYYHYVLAYDNGNEYVYYSGRADDPFEYGLNPRVQKYYSYEAAKYDVERVSRKYIQLYDMDDFEEDVKFDIIRVIDKEEVNEEEVDSEDDYDDELLTLNMDGSEFIPY